jgi:RNA 2',3'-cyclic 3'-phosphodiesterase
MNEARLFVALRLADPLVNAVGLARPGAMPGVRVTPNDRLHLTLHYIGLASLRDTVDCLRTVVLSQVPITVDGFGQFDGKSGSRIVWARVQRGDELERLHERVARALAPIGFSSEDRPWTPHVTLAYCEASVLATNVAEMVAKGRSLLASGVCTWIDLYSSRLVNDAPHYSLEASFELNG